MDRLDILPVQYALFFIYIQKKNNDMNRQKSELLINTSYTKCKNKNRV